MADNHFDIVVIGGGPGGYVGAIRAAQLGYKTAIVDRAKLGGICLNWGCIPSKALLTNAEVMDKINHQEFWGLKFEGPVSFDWDKIIGRSRDTALKLNKGVEFLMKKNDITHFQAHAKITRGASGGQPCEIQLYDCEVEETLSSAPADPADNPRESITADRIMIATGAVARDLPFARFDREKIWGSREAMYNKERPNRLLVIGSGAIGMEFGYFYHSFGSEVTVVEMLDRILPAEDEEISKQMYRHYKKDGMKFELSSTLTAVDTSGDGVKATIAPFRDGDPVHDEAKTIEVDRLLLAIGVRGRFDGLFDDSLGIEIVKDHIKTDYVPLGPESPMTAPVLTYKTSVDGIHAVGDVIGPPWLAHVASEEALACVERMAYTDGKLKHEPIPIDYTIVPACTYTQPQVASIGFTEKMLTQRGLKKGEDFEVGQFPFTALGKAIAAAHTAGFVKIIRGLPHGEILGAHLMGAQATELIAELSLARRMEATTEDLIATIHAHPTMHESIHEAALASEGRVIHT